MNKKGFTLVELLAVIVILSILAVISFAIIFKLIDNSRNDIYNSNINTIETAAEKWAAQNSKLIGKTTPYCLDVDRLVSGGYIKADSLKDPRQKNAGNITGYVKISYDNAYNQYEYKYVGSNCN